MSIRLLIADDHGLMRESLRALIEKEPGMSVAGEADSGKTTIALARKLSADVVIMDVAMPDVDGIKATQEIALANPKTRIVALSGHADRHFVTAMLKAGASAYVLKQGAYEELIRAIREVMSGRTYLSPDVTRGVVDSFVRPSSAGRRPPAFSSLTDRECAVLKLLADGMSAKAIAADLKVSEKTIATHRRNIMDKLDLHSVAELTKYAIREGVTSV